MLKLYTDSDTDVTPAVAKAHGYSGYIPMPYSVDAKTVRPYVDFETFDCHGFYDMLRAGTLPTTSALSKERYTEIFEPDFAAGNDILYVHFSRAMTATFDAMDQAVAELKAKYPGVRFEEIDCKGITTICYPIVLKAGDMAAEGKSLDDILAWAREDVDHWAMYFFADDLKFFRRSGRVSGLAATMGTLIGLRPIIYMSPEGKMVSCGTEKGRMKAMLRLVGEVMEKGLDVKEHGVYIGHTDAPELAQEVGKMLREKLGEDLGITYVECNPTAGSHAGPNGVGVCFHAKER